MIKKKELFFIIFLFTQSLDFWSLRLVLQPKGYSFFPKMKAKLVKELFSHTN